MASKPQAPQAPKQRLLYSRKQAGELLGGVSVATLKRLEDEGLLRPIKLSRSATAQTFYAADAIAALIEGAVNG